MSRFFCFTLILGLIGFVGCAKTVDTVEDAGDTAVEAVEGATDATVDAVKDAADATGDAVKDAATTVEEKL